MGSEEIVVDLFWGYWANIFYIFGMFGYLTMDTLMFLTVSMETRLISFVYTFLGVILLVDAILYSIDWFTYAVKSRENDDVPIEFRSEFVACCFHYLGSFGYLIGSLTSFNRSDFFNVFLLLNFLGSLAFLFESAFTFLGWIITLKRNKTKNPKRSCSTEVKRLEIFVEQNQSFRLFRTLHFGLIFSISSLELFIFARLHWPFDFFKIIEFEIPTAF